MKKSEQHKNIAFVDGQNLHMGTAKMKSDPWNIDLKRFRRYLDEKLEVKEAYYFLGCLDEEYGDIYTNLQKAGFILVFREHSNSMLGKKKGNVDVDIVFEVMKMLCNQENFDKVVLVSGDGDYKKMVDFLIEKNKSRKVFFIRM